LSPKNGLKPPKHLKTGNFSGNFFRLLATLILFSDFSHLTNPNSTLTCSRFIWHWRSLSGNFLQPFGNANQFFERLNHARRKRKSDERETANSSDSGSKAISQQACHLQNA
jgi:hypothetical protein